MENKPILKFEKTSFIMDSNDAYIEYLYQTELYNMTVLNNLKAKNDFEQFSKEYIQKSYDNSQIEYDHLDSLVNTMKNDENNLKAIYWYTKDCFLYRMINQTLRKQNYLEIFKIRIFLKLLKKQIEDNSYKGDDKVTLFRGSLIHKEEIKNLRNSINSPILLNSFISTSKLEHVAKDFLLYTKNDNKDLIKILYIFDLDNTCKNKFASIKEFSDFSGEEEFLINFNNFFKISNIEHNS
jgi:hypothetical protein